MSRYLLAVIMTCLTTVNAVNETKSISTQMFSQKLVAEFGSDGALNVEQLGQILDKLGMFDAGTTREVEEIQQKSNNCSAAKLVLSTQSIDDSPVINPSQLAELCPSILYSAVTGQCSRQSPYLMELSSGNNETDTSPTKAEMWGYGFLFVTIINLSALGGLWVVPIMNKKVYKMVLMFLICLAVGTLCGNALLSLIPEAHGMLVEDEGTMFIWKNLTVIGGIYLFFLTERILKMISTYRRRNITTSSKPPAHTFHTSAMHDDIPPDERNIKITAPYSALSVTESYNASINENNMPNNTSLVSTTGNGTNNEHGTSNRNGTSSHPANGHGHSHDVSFDKDNMIASVAYMIIFGDGLHNFIDGLAIGASFSYATYAGVSTSIAVICEEFPHELGDFAILLNSGMSVKQAVLANVASACTCYLGLIIGIVLGETTESEEWIFALAGGMFLYISLVDMLPEINSAKMIDENDGKAESVSSMLKVFIIQNAGLLSGFALMLILALYAGKIQI